MLNPPTSDFLKKSQAMEKPADRLVIEIQAKIKAIHQAFRDDGTLFEDKEFPALDAFLFENEQELENAKKDTQNWEWVRPSDIIKNPNFDDPSSPANYELKAGKYTSKNFLNAIALISNNSFYRSIFVDYQNIEKGYAVCQF